MARLMHLSVFNRYEAQAQSADTSFDLLQPLVIRPAALNLSFNILQCPLGRRHMSVGRLLLKNKYLGVSHHRHINMHIMNGSTPETK